MEVTDQQRQFALALLGYTAQREIAIDRLCHLANLKLNDIQRKRAVITSKQLADLWLNAMRLSNDNLFGLHFGEALQLQALGIVGAIIKSSETIGAAFTHAAALTHLITTDFELDIVKQEKTFAIRFIPVNNKWQQIVFLKQILDFLLVFVIHELDGLLLKKIVPKKVYYPNLNENIQEYQRLMRCRPTTHASDIAIILDIKYWNALIVTADYELQQQLLKCVAIFQNKPGNKKTFRYRIYSYLITNSYLGLTSIDNIAANFNMSTRTLQRKLKIENVNFKTIADEARLYLATHYLKNRDYPVKEISYMLGYNEPSAFNRTFKRWTGTTPVKYQKSIIDN